MIRNALKTWAPLAVLATFIIGTMYTVIHQILWETSYDTQIQLAEDWANDIVKSGVQTNKLDLGNFIDPSQSYQPFGIVYDQDGNIIASSVSAPTNMLQPSGVFDAVDAAANTETKYVWQPTSGVRYATVIKRATLSDKSASYYVLSGRNLGLVEQHQAQLLWLSFLGWVITLVGTLVALNVHLVGRHVVRHYKARREARKTNQS